MGSTRDSVSLLLALRFEPYYLTIVIRFTDPRKTQLLGYPQFFRSFDARRLKVHFEPG